MNFLSIADQIAAHLHAEILRGRWGTAIPGRHQLAAEFGVNSKTVEAALRQLEKTGVLVPQGAGRPRLIRVKPAEAIRELRIGFLHLERHEEQREEHLIQLWHALAEAGHQVVSAQQTLMDMQFEVKRVAAVAEPKVASATTAPSTASANWAAGMRPASTSSWMRRARTATASVSTASGSRTLTLAGSELMS